MSQPASWKSPSTRHASRMATISAWAVGSLARVTWLVPVEITIPSFTTSAANGPPFRRTFSTARSIACLRNVWFMGRGRHSIAYTNGRGPGERGLWPDRNDRPGGLSHLWLDEARADGVPHHAGGLVDAQLFQYPAAVRVGCLVADPQLRGGLFGRLAVGDEHQPLPFPLRQREDDPHRFLVRDEHALLAVRDIGHRPHESRKLAIGVIARHSGALHPGIRLVRPLQAELHPEGLPGVESPQVSFHAQVPIVRVQAFHPAAAGLLFGSPAAEMEAGAVHVVAFRLRTGGDRK